jgi:hypothetical protein
VLFVCARRNSQQTSRKHPHSVLALASAEVENLGLVCRETTTLGVMEKFLEQTTLADTGLTAQDDTRPCSLVLQACSSPRNICRSA